MLGKPGGPLATPRRLRPLNEALSAFIQGPGDGRARGRARRQARARNLLPRVTDIASFLFIGAGPIVIGQACEFDYSGVQACKAHSKADGYRDHPGQLQSGHDHDRSGDRRRPPTSEPITVEMVEQIIAKERPDALLPTMGGQTALNIAMALERSGVLARYGVEMIGADADAIEKAEDRQKFRDAMDAIGLESPAFAPGPFARRGPRSAGGDRPPGDHPPLLHPGRQRRGSPTTSRSSGPDIVEQRLDSLSPRPRPRAGSAQCGLRALARAYLAVAAARSRCRASAKPQL